jgi:ribA/ribD-fused uncharacterized protein
MEAYTKNAVCWFSKVKEQWGELSNMSNDCPVKVNGIQIKNTEALYQAARFPDYPEIQMEILKGHSGMASKMTSKKYRKTHTREDWDTVKNDIMRYCLELKLYYNYRTIKMLLDESGQRAIVEKSHKDTYWGAVEKDGLLQGDNILGKLWMDIRTDPARFYTKPGHNIPNFKLNSEDVK